MNNLISCILALHLGVHSAFEWKEELAQSPPYTYPYLDLEAQLEKEGKQTITIFSYGSLLARKSARRTLSPKTLKTGNRAVALGLRRVFNRDIPIDPKKDWGIPCDPASRAMLNIIATGNPDDITNGIVFEVCLEDIAPMRQREYGYDLIPILVTSWEGHVKGDPPEYTIAYTFHSPKESHFTHDNIYPRPGYYELARDAAKDQGQEFYRMWMDSTYLSDEVTSIKEWEKVVQSQDPRSLNRKTHCILSP